MNIDYFTRFKVNEIKNAFCNNNDSQEKICYTILRLRKRLLLSKHYLLDQNNGTNPIIFPEVSVSSAFHSCKGMSNTHIKLKYLGWPKFGL